MGFNAYTKMNKPGFILVCPSLFSVKELLLQVGIIVLILQNTTSE